MRFRVLLAAALLSAGSSPVWAAAPAEKRIKRADLPAAVEKAVAERSKRARIKGFKMEIEGGRNLYEAELLVAGRTKDILFDESGAVVEIEEEVVFDSLPPAVKKGLTKAAAGGQLGKVESLTKKGVLKAYEAVVKIGKRRLEIQVGPDGGSLAKPE